MTDFGPIKKHAACGEPLIGLHVCSGRDIRLENLREELREMDLNGPQRGHWVVDGFEAAVDAKARADERDKVVKEALEATNGLRVELEPLGIHFYKPDGTEVTLGEVLTAIARNGGSGDERPSWLRDEIARAHKRRAELPTQARVVRIESNQEYGDGV